jgi:hypothetical protein
MAKTWCSVFLFTALTTTLAAQEKPTLSPVTKGFVTVDAPVTALVHVHVIDGTGSPAEADQTILIENGMIKQIGSAGSVAIPAGARVLDLTGRSVIPGLVGMHDHMFYPAASGQPLVEGTPALYGEMGFSFPRLYLASNRTPTSRSRNSSTPAKCPVPKFTSLGRISKDSGHLLRNCTS